MKLYKEGYHAGSLEPENQEATLEDVAEYLAERGLVAANKDPDALMVRELFADICSSDLINDDDLGLEFYKLMIDTVGAEL